MGATTKKGKFIVIDGIDGSGKETQTALLVTRLKKEERRVKTIDFPRYYDNFFGELIGECLIGDLGNFVSIHPKIASVLYAADRFESGDMIRRWLTQGFTVVADRYVSANQIHQGGKIKSPAERKKFLAWLDKMEHEIFEIPRPDLIVYLDLPLEVSRNLLKNNALKKSKRYTKGKKDTVENNLRYLRQSRESALYLSRINKNWVRVSCCNALKRQGKKSRESVFLSPEQIHEKVFDAVKSRLR